MMVNPHCQLEWDLNHYGNTFLEVSARVDVGDAIIQVSTQTEQKGES